MAQEMFTAEQFWAELEETGEDTVRIRVATKTIYGPHNKKLQLAEEWLRKLDRERAETDARSAKRAARTANIAAIIAAAAAVIASIAAIISLFQSGGG